MIFYPSTTCKSREGFFMTRKKPSKKIQLFSLGISLQKLRLIISIILL